MNEEKANGRKLPDYVIIGQITKPHGVRGALKVEPLTDDPERYRLLERVFLTFDEKQRTAYSVNKVQVGPSFVYLTLDNVSDRTQAEALKSAFIEIPRAECLPLEEGRHYYFELIGCRVVLKDGSEVGVLEDIQSNPAHDLYVVRSGEREILIPDRPEIIVSINIEKATMVIDPVEGLLELGQ